MMADRGIGLLPWPLGSQGVRMPMCSQSQLTCGFCTSVVETTATLTISKSAVLNCAVKSISASLEHRVWCCVRQSSARNSTGPITPTLKINRSLACIHSFKTIINVKITRFILLSKRHHYWSARSLKGAVQLLTSRGRAAHRVSLSISLTLYAGRIACLVTVIRHWVTVRKAEFKN